jgi:cysteinyl-tRNA synthetase
VDSMKDYGGLSNRKLEDQQAGARVAVDAHKKNPADFVLWKLSSSQEPGWDSPWGRGRPGWHIECSAMSKRYLGEVFDIHGGGLDLIFPHHENEIAQSRCAHGTSVMANVWMHNGFLQVEGQKMSKSLGNFVTINELLNSEIFGERTWDGQVLRLAMLKTHYRQPIDWTARELKDMEIALDKWMAMAKGVPPSKIPDAIMIALADDFNTPQVVAELFALVRSKEIGALSASLALLGFNPTTYVSGVKRSIRKSQSKMAAREIESLVSSRLAARDAKNWKESDRIRDELDAIGIAIKDNKDGTTSWEVKR